MTFPAPAAFLLIPLSAVLILTGCASTPTRTIRIESEPPGARVFVGTGANEDYADGSRQYVGQAPCEWTTECTKDGRWKLSGALVYGSFVPPVAVFTAEPPSGQTNLYTKRQVFQSGTFFTPPDKVPQALFFDLTQP